MGSLVIAKGTKEIVIGLECMGGLEKRFLDLGYKKQSGVGRVVGDQEGAGRDSQWLQRRLASWADVQERSERKRVSERPLIFRGLWCECLKR